jgi:flagella basal body P-ring formation protein FlgA
MTAYQATLKRSNPHELSPRLAGKLLAIILALTLVVGLLVCGIDKAFAAPLAADIHTAPAPKPDVMVKGENIRLGDVFDGVTQNADFVLAPAPQPGEELVWNTPTLLRIATAFDLPWRPQAGDEVRIRRDASLVDSGTLKSMIRDYLSRDAGSDSFNVSFTSEVPEIVVPNNGTPRIQLADFNMQPLGGTFSAIVKVSDAAGQHAQTVNLRGVAERVITVPVLKSAMHNGEIIQASDVIYVTRKASAVGPNFVRTADELVGTTPRRALPAGELIRPDTVQAPQMVSRGDLVTMVFNQNGMYLTARGRALEDGALGETIKVANSNSNRTVEARVTNVKEVTIN